MDKIAALIPLLGWFYISILCFACAYVLLPKLRKVLTIVFYGGFSLLFLSTYVSQLKTEIQLIPFSLKVFSTPFESKIEDEAGNYYRFFYTEVRPQLRPGDTVLIRGFSTRELHYARMYIYPNGINEFTTIGNPGLYLLTTDEVKELEIQYEERARWEHRVLVELVGNDEP